MEKLFLGHSMDGHFMVIWESTWGKRKKKTTFVLLPNSFPLALNECLFNKLISVDF